MSDEARDAHLQWLDDCARAQVVDYETWLEGRVARAEGMLSIAMGENQRLTKHVEDYEEENATLKAKLAAIECAGCGKTMLECECDMESE